jgi:hypothetical protein
MERAARILSFLRNLESHYRDIGCSSEPQTAITNSSINLLSCNVSSLDFMQRAVLGASVRRCIAWARLGTAE